MSFSKTSLASSSDSGLIPARAHKLTTQITGEHTVFYGERWGRATNRRMSTLLQNLPPLSLAPVVAKPPTINSRRQRPSPSTGQQAVFAFLKRKHESYLRRLSLLRDGASTVPVGRNTWDLPDRGE